MSDEREQQATIREVVQRLMRETGISEAEALELVGFLGSNWPSLVREARMISSASCLRRLR